MGSLGLTSKMCFHFLRQFFILMIIVVLVSHAKRRKRNFRKAACSRDPAQPTNKLLMIKRRDVVLIKAEYGVKECNVRMQAGPSCGRLKLICQPVERYYINCREGDKFVVTTVTRSARLCNTDR